MTIRSRSWCSMLVVAAMTPVAANGFDRVPVGVRNNLCAIEFVPGSGELASIRNVPLNDPVLKGKPPFGTPFRIHADFAREWLLNANPEQNAQTHLGPAGLTLKTVAGKSSSEGEVLDLTYIGGGFECRLRVALAAGSGDSTWTLSVKNVGAGLRDTLVEFPRFNGVQPGPGDARDVQTVLNQAGWLGEAWKGGGGIYGNGGQWSMQWHAIFDPLARSALGLIVMDPEIRNKRLVVNKPNLAIEYFPPRKLAPSETLTLPSVRLLVYEGDWKRTAREYAAWYAKTMPHAIAPQWFRESDMIDGQHFRKRKGSDDRPDRGGPFALDTFRELPAAVLHAPVDNTEYAFWSRGSMLHGVHTDGDNLVRSDLGGAEAMRDGFAAVHKLGLHSTLYIEGYIVHKASDLAKSGKAQRWSVMHRDGSILGSYTNQGFFHMCPGCVEWQDHLVSVVKRVLTECQPDGVRLDSLGFYFLPCYNPAHQHRSPFEYNEWVKQLLSKVRDAAVAVTPDVLLTTEAPVDFYGQWFHGALTQVYSAAIPPMRLAVGPYRPVAYAPAGAVWASLSGVAGGHGSWACARVPACEALVWGDVADEDPKTSDPAIVCRRFVGERCEAIVAARVPQHDFRWPEGVKLLKERKRYDILIPARTMPQQPIALCDVETLNWQSGTPVLRDGNLVVNTESNWLLIVVPRGEQRVVTFDPLPQARPGAEVTLRPATLAGPGSGEVEVWAPGLQVGPAGEPQARVRIGDKVAIHVPEQALPGWYQVRLRGDNTLGVKRLLHVAGPKVEPLPSRNPPGR